MCSLLLIIEIEIHRNKNDEKAEYTEENDKH